MINRRYPFFLVYLNNQAIFFRSTSADIHVYDQMGTMQIEDDDGNNYLNV